MSNREPSIRQSNSLSGSSHLLAFFAASAVRLRSYDLHGDASLRELQVVYSAEDRGSHTHGLR